MTPITKTEDSYLNCDMHCLALLPRTHQTTLEKPLFVSPRPPANLNSQLLLANAVKVQHARSVANLVAKIKLKFDKKLKI